MSYCSSRADGHRCAGRPKLGYRAQDLESVAHLGEGEGEGDGDGEGEGDGDGEGEGERGRATGWGWG